MKTVAFVVIGVALLGTQAVRATDPRVQGLPLPAPKKVEDFVKLLKSEEVQVRRDAAHSLYGLKWNAAPAAHALVEAMKDSDPEVRGWAAGCFRFLGPRVACPKDMLPMLVQLLQKDDDIHVRAIAALSLRELTLRDKAITKDAAAVFLKYLDAKDRYIRLNMSVALVILGEGGDKPADCLTEMLGTKDSDFQDEVVEAVGDAGLGMLPALRKARDSKNVRVRRIIPLCVVSIISELEQKNRITSIPTLELPPGVALLLGSLLDDADEQVVINAIRGLRAVGEPAAEFVPTITQKLGHTNAWVRHAAVMALGAVGPKAKDSIPAIEKVLADDDWNVRRVVSKSLAKISWKSAIPALEKSLTDSHRLVRFAAVETLETLREEPEVATTLLIRAFKDKDEVVRSKAVLVLSKFNPGAASVTAITNMLADPDSNVREAAASALGVFGGASKKAVPELVKMLKDRSCWVRCRAVESLGKIHYDAATVVPALMAALEDEHPAVREWATKTLGSFGREAKIAIPKLTALSDDPNLGDQAKQSLKQIQQDK